MSATATNEATGDTFECWRPKPEKYLKKKSREGPGLLAASALSSA